MRPPIPCDAHGRAACLNACACCTASLHTCNTHCKNCMIAKSCNLRLDKLQHALASVHDAARRNPPHCRLTYDRIAIPCTPIYSWQKKRTVERREQKVTVLNKLTCDANAHRTLAPVGITHDLVPLVTPPLKALKAPPKGTEGTKRLRLNAEPRARDCPSRATIHAMATKRRNRARR